MSPIALLTHNGATPWLDGGWPVHLLDEVVWLAECQREERTPVIEYVTNWGVALLGVN